MHNDFLCFCLRLIYGYIMFLLDTQLTHTHIHTQIHTNWIVWFYWHPLYFLYVIFLSTFSLVEIQTVIRWVIFVFSNSIIFLFFLLLTSFFACWNASGFALNCDVCKEKPKQFSICRLLIWFNLSVYLVCSCCCCSFFLIHLFSYVNFDS